MSTLVPMFLTVGCTFTDFRIVCEIEKEILIHLTLWGSPWPDGYIKVSDLKEEVGSELFGGEGGEQ